MKPVRVLNLFVNFILDYVTKFVKLIMLLPLNDFVPKLDSNSNIYLLKRQIAENGTKHKHSSFKCSDSELKTQEPPTMSKSNKVISGPSSDSGATEPIKNSAENQSNLKSKGFRSLLNTAIWL